MGKYYRKRLTPRLLSKRYYARRAVIRETSCGPFGSTVLAYAALWRTKIPEWYELGTVFVDEKIGGNGVCLEIMQEVVAFVPNGMHVFLVTDAEPVMKAAQKLGFIPVTLGTPGITLRFIRKVMGSGRPIPESVYPYCSSESCSEYGIPTAGERWMFVRTTEE